MKTHKTDNRKLGPDAIDAPRTMCGIMESYTRTKKGALGQGYWWHQQWSHVTCKRCLAKREAPPRDRKAKERGERS